MGFVFLCTHDISQGHVPPNFIGQIFFVAQQISIVIRFKKNFL
jgi:hypothetical protein